MIGKLIRIKPPIKSKIDFSKDVLIYEDLISDEEEDLLVREMDEIFSKKQYEDNHYDHVIFNYKETEIKKFKYKGNETVMNRVVDFLNQKLQGKKFSNSYIHAIDLKEKTGEIKKHVDSLKYGGDVVSGLSILSTRSMKLTDNSNECENTGYIEMILPRKSLYVLQNNARYEMAHEILCKDYNERRISFIFRDEKIPSWLKTS